MTGRWCRHKQKCARAHGQQTYYHRALIADPVNDLSRWYGEKKIRSKEGKLNEHDLCVIQVEDWFQVRNENVIETSQKAPHKK